MSTALLGSARIPDRQTYLADVKLSRRIQTFGAWCGTGFVFLLFGGWGLLGGFIPLISAGKSATGIAAALSTNHTLHLIGLTLGMIGVFITIPFYLVISAQISRSEPRLPLLAGLQLASGVLITAVLMIPMLFFFVEAFRPDRSPELSQLLNDTSYILLILPWPPILGQVFAVAITALRVHPVVRIFPRWIGYLDIWIALLVMPATMIVFFKTGIFAWTGLIGFWIPAAAFGLWYPIMTWALLRAIREQHEADIARASEYALSPAKESRKNVLL